VLLCDEPTGNLDRRTSEMVADLLIRLASEGLAVIVATHDLQIAAMMGRLLDIDDGLVTERSSAPGPNRRPQPEERG
jgi:ABC-type lipoprotein export system ATPase subunit